MKRWAELMMATLLVACGGGGGGGGSTEKTGISADYYPVSTGARWAYEVTASTTTASFVDEVAIIGTQLVSGISAWVFRESNPAGDGVATDSYYAKDARAYTYLGDSYSPDWLGSVMGSFDMMRFDGTFSASPLLTRTNVDIGQDLDGDMINERVDVQINGIVEGYETLGIDVGSFANTARLRYTVTGTIRLSRGGTFPFTETIRDWRAPGIGTLRQTVQMDMADTSESTRLELRGLLVNGVMAGLLAPRELLGNLATADSDTTRPGQPAAASDGTRYLLVSNRQSGSFRQWVGQFIGADGQLQESIDISPVIDTWGSPSVAWNGSKYLVITGAGNAYGMRAQRISASGVVLDTYPGVDLALDGYNRALAAGAGKWLAVYGRTSNVGTLYGRFISDAGAVGDEFVIATGAVSYSSPAVAFNGESFVVVWESAGNAGDPSTVDLYAMRISQQGTLLDGAALAVSTAPEAQYGPQLACDTANCLIVWVDRRNYPGQSYSFSPGPGDMYGAFITRAGVVLNGAPASGAIPIATGITANPGYPALAYTGADYLVAWSRGAYVNNPGGPTGIYAAHVGTDGSVLTSAPGLAVSFAPDFAARHVYPTLAASSTGVLAAWLKNVEVWGQSKSVAGTVIWPGVTR